MKKLLIALILLPTITFAQKPIKVEGTVDDWAKHLAKLIEVKKIISTYPGITQGHAGFCYSTLDSIDMFIRPQVLKQIDTTKKK